MRKLLLMVLLVCCMLMCAVAQAAQVTDVKWGVNKSNVLRIVVDVTDTAGYDVEMEDSTLSLMVNAKKSAQAPAIKTIKSDVAKSFQVIAKGNNTLVQLALKKKLSAQSYKAFVLKKDASTGRPFRVVLDVTQPQYSNSNAATSTMATAADAAVVSNKPIVSNKPTKAGSRQTTTVKTSAIKGNGKFRTSGGIKGKIITLDAGHGGTDPGAIGSDGTREKDITLPITKKLKELLEQRGATVYMTRTTDVDVSGPNASDAAELQARVNVAEKYNSDLFVSLHINSSTSKSVGGFSTYYYPKTDYDLKVAKNIQNQLAANFGVDDLGVRQANFYVIKRSSMPATLIEMCFISNEKELTLMKGNWFQNKTARLIADGIEKYFN